MSAGARWSVKSHLDAAQLGPAMLTSTVLAKERNPPWRYQVEIPCGWSMPRTARTGSGALALGLSGWGDGTRPVRAGRAAAGG